MLRHQSSNSGSSRMDFFLDLSFIMYQNILCSVAKKVLRLRCINGKAKKPYQHRQAIYFVERFTTTISHSDIMDFPIYPDDLVPKVLQGTDIKRNGWFPWIYGMCTDNDGQPLFLVLSLNVGFGGSRVRAYVKGTYLDVKPNE